MTRRLLVTGGFGFVGGRLVEHLRAAEPGLEIALGTRDPGRPRPPWTQPHRAVGLDLGDAGALARAVRGFDAIIHLAGLDEADSKRDPVAAVEVNTLGTYRLLRAAVGRVERFVYVSTIHVYGESLAAGRPVTEETPTRPWHPYAITRRAAEDFVHAFRVGEGLRSLVLRVSNGYGRPMDPGIARWSLLVNDLCRQAVRTGRLVLATSGRQSRDFVSLHDVARAVHHLLFGVPDSWGDGLFNVGGECSMTVLEMARRVGDVFERVSGRAAEVATADLSPAESPQLPFRYSIDKLKATGFALEGRMDEEIEGCLRIAGA